MFWARLSSKSSVARGWWRKTIISSPCVPYAPRFCRETGFCPSSVELPFEKSPSHMFENPARALKDLLSRADRVLDNPPYNPVIHTSPAQDPTSDHYHYYTARAC